MYVDASALVAMIVGETDADALLSALEESDSKRITAPIAMFEAAAGIARIRACPPADARALVHDFLREAEIAIVPIDERHGDLAVAAMERFGKERHPAALNMGDCFAYAVAMVERVSILYKGDGFSRTDLVAAWRT